MKYLKPLHQVLAENPHHFGRLGTIYFDEHFAAIGVTEFVLFGGSINIEGYPNNFYYEVEETT
jgi:hypothetical protein